MIVTSIEEINPIWADNVTILKASDIDNIVELPLVEACRTLFKKNIRTVMSSCNKYNILGYSKYDEEHVGLGRMMKEIYSYGDGYAWIMLDYDSLEEKNKQILGALNDQNPELCLYTISDSIKFLKSDEEFKKRCKKISKYEQNYGYRAVLLRYPLSIDTTIEEVTNYFNTLVEKFYNQEKELNVANSTRNLLLNLANKYKDVLKKNEIEINEETFLNFSLENKEGLLSKYGLDNNSELLAFLFVISVLDINNLLEEPNELMILRFEQDYIHFLFNGEEFTITGRKEVISGNIIKFASSEKTKEQLTQEAELLDLYSNIDSGNFFYFQNIDVTNALKSI